MSADLLRRAAAKLREHARYAGEWATVFTDSESLTGFRVCNDHQADEHDVCDNCHDVETYSEPLAAYVVLMHTPVGRALGDVFERLAYLDRGAVNAIDNDLMADLEHLAAQVLREDGES
jgi:hypothetical protein